MTPQQAFEAALRERLRERAANVLGTNQAVIALLSAARDQITVLLASQPPDWQQWQLRPLLDQLAAILEGATGKAATAVDIGLRTAWQQGEDFVDKPLAAGGFNVELQLPLLNVQVLSNLQRFTEVRFKDVGAEATRKIGNHLSLVTLGASTPMQAIKQVQQTLGSDSPRRATTIVRTEVGRAFAVASHERLVQAAKLVPGLQKRWRRSGKIHSRWNHDAADGQIQEVDQPFVLPSNDGPVKLMHPHDPQAPVEEVINCGCVALPFKATWKVAVPGAKPFSELELRQDGRKAALDQAAKRAGMRREGPPPAPVPAPTPAPAPTGGKAYQAAQAGGAHAGWYRLRHADGPVQLNKAIRSFEARRSEHLAWIANPGAKVENWASLSEGHQARLIAGWQQDAQRHAEFIDILHGVLSEKAKKP